MNDPRWIFVVRRDISADGTFCYSVKSTGVYCRPSCGSRLARPENVQFHPTCEDAERAGFRSCKRCKPNDARTTESAMNSSTIGRNLVTVEHSVITDHASDT